MSTIVVEMTAREAAVWKAQQRLIDQQASMRDGYANTGRAAQDTANKIKGAGQAGKSAFGTSAVNQITSYITGLLGVSAAIGKITQMFQEMEQARAEAAQRQREARLRVAELGQLAETPEQMAALVREAKDVYAAGGAQDLDQAARTVFALRSAAADKYIEFFTQLRATGLVAAPDVMARAAKTLETTMGEAETGTFEDLVSKAFGASKFAPSRAEELLEAAARAGTSAGKLGLSDEEVLAAAAIVSTGKGTAEMGGTYLAQMMRTVEEKGKFRGKPLDEVIQQITAELRGLEPEKQKEWWGRAQGREAFDILSQNLGTFREALATVRQAQVERRGGLKAELPAGIPELRAAAEAERQQAREELSRERLGIISNLTDAALADYAARVRKGEIEPMTALPREMGLTIEQLGIRAGRFLRGDEPMLRAALRNRMVSDELAEQIKQTLAEIEPERPEPVFRSLFQSPYQAYLDRIKQGGPAPPEIDREIRGEPAIRPRQSPAAIPPEVRIERPAAPIVPAAGGDGAAAGGERLGGPYRPGQPAITRTSEPVKAEVRIDDARDLKRAAETMDRAAQRQLDAADRIETLGRQLAEANRRPERLGPAPKRP